MAIYAQRTAFRSSAQFPDFKVTELITDGQLLQYDDTLRAFINVDASIVTGGGGGGTVTNGVNLGTGSQILSGLNVTDLEFRTLLGGQGISLVQGTNEIEITNTVISTGSISVTDSFDIVIDNDDSTVSSAVFSLSTVDNPATVSFIPTTYTRTDITTVNPNQFTTAAGDFIAAGFAAGMSLKVTGTTEQDGIWEIASVTTDTITITLGAFPDLTDLGLQPSTTFEGILFEFPTGNTLQMSGRDVAADGFLATQSMTVVGSTNNDGTYLITAATGTTITISGSGATATSTRTADVVTGTTITAAGSGYIALPIVTFADPTAGTTATGTSTLGALTATVVARGSGYVVADVLTFVGGTQTEAAIFDVNNLSTVVGQDETYFNNSPTTEGTFVAGTGYAATDTITMSDGTVVTVDAVAVGVITQFTITTASTSGIVGDAQTLTQGSTSGNGAGFTLTLDADNQGVFDVTVTATDGNYSVLPTEPIATTTGGTGSGVTLNADWGVVSIVITDGGTGYTVDPAITISAWVAGNDVGNITVSVAAETLATGWQVDETGAMSANDTTITGALASTTLTVGGTDINTIIDNALPVFPADGILVRTALDTYTAVSIAVDTTLIVANATGITGDPTLGIIDDVVLPGNGAVTIPSGNNGGRPGTPTSGMIRHHSVNDEIETYIGAQWVTLFTGVATDFLAITGGTLTGDLALGANNITTIGTVDGRDVAADGVILDAINTGTGIKVQTAADTFVNRTIAGTAPIVLTNGDGVSGNPTVTFDITSATPLEVGQIVDEVNDYVLIYDASQAAMRSVSPQRLSESKVATRYFMAQI